ncbi:winged helix-turn-helix domain-containing protein [Alginatibacterium sediminis]|uniref:Winged helix-turn-helix domain-containing protein n=1 Tax=Alginatibacterium sediminis TaxID=2164068 RepID=A0A420EBN2_9ALTE|nr:crosslink repair DNA glycosylase YcaQ family protein [Alginatibacterium sediminis]RKF18081.1 winged helix-turn-helix domain-containing protein [Alginatibacterium sediminis]
MQSLSIPQARKLALLAQGLPKQSSKSSPLSRTLSAFERLGYVQIDTISVVQRAHHHTLWSRNPSYQLEHLDQLVADKHVFEYWAHAAAYLPMRDFRYTLVRKAAIKSGEQKHWYSKDHKLMAEVLKRIEHEGPLMAKDFSGESYKSNGWGSKPTKQALENLFIQGDLMITQRKNFHKVYDLSSRVLPSHVDTSMPSEQEYGHFLVLSYLNAHAFGNLSQITYQQRSLKPLVVSALEQLSEEGKLSQLTINGDPFYVLTSALVLLNNRLNKKQAKILSPFDNLLIQRARASAVFNFDYLLECYVPAAKRQYGYFSLPILWDGTLVARADCKVDKSTQVLNVISLTIESSVRHKDAFLSALEAELKNFASFNQCLSYRINLVNIIEN